MRTLAPIRVRKTDTRYLWQYTCRLCGGESRWEHRYAAQWYGLRHLSRMHPWPWASAELDNDGGVK